MEKAVEWDQDKVVPEESGRGEEGFEKYHRRERATGRGQGRGRALEWDENKIVTEESTHVEGDSEVFDKYDRQDRGPRGGQGSGMSLDGDIKCRPTGVRGVGEVSPTGGYRARQGKRERERNRKG
jgi:hypothetical protein